MATVAFLLPSQERLVGKLSPALATALGRSDPMPATEPGERAQILRYFDLLPRGWPVAALTRQADVGDAASSIWLRADPAWVRPDINGARLYACGDALQLMQEDVDALLPVLRPLFGDAGFAIDAPVPSRWYLRLSRGTRLPEFAEPADALGADLFEYLPHEDDARHWRTLLSEAQVVLHNHPWNARRAAAGKPPVNSLWFWGGGVLPDHVTTRITVVQTDESMLRALAIASGTNVSAQPAGFMTPQRDTLVDLRATRDLASLTQDWLLPAIVALRRGALQHVQLDFSDGSGYRLERRQRWRFWRKPLSGLRHATTPSHDSELN